MTKCKICGKELQRLTPSHANTHGMSLVEYYKEHDHERYRQTSIREFLLKHYVTVKSRYLKYGSNGMVYTVDVRTNGKYKQIPLNDGNLNAHIKGEYCIGVYFLKEYTKFIGFDLDIIDTEKLELVYNTLFTYGIDTTSIFMSYSGNKGFHIDVLIDGLIKKTVVKKFYEMVLAETGLTSKELEIRGAGAQGYKLPLGYHPKTGSFCFLCDENGQKIDELQAIEHMTTTKPQAIYDALSINYEPIKNESHIVAVEEMKNSVPYTDQYENKGRRRKIENILENGLSATGNRNKTCFEVALYCKDVRNLCLADTIIFIRNWIQETWKPYAEPERFLASKEIEQTVKSAFNGKYKFSSRYEDVTCPTDTETSEVYTVKHSSGKTQSGLQNLYFRMIIHAKGYAGADGIFSMSYDQIRKLGINNNRSRFKSQIEELMKIRKLERYEPKEKRLKNGKTSPYLYRLPDFEKIRGTGTKVFSCETISRCKDCLYQTYNCLINQSEPPKNSKCNGKVLFL